MNTSARRASRTRWSCSSELGPEARLLAGGHSLLPMMKLRLADARVPDRHRSAGRASSATSSEHDDEVRIGAMTRHRALLESPLLARAARDLHRRRARDRRPGRPQPRHDRRRALPGRPVRGPLRGVRGGRRADGDPRARRRARRRTCTTSTAARTRPRSAPAEMLSRSACRCSRARRQRLREGRPARRRLGGRRRRRVADARRRRRDRARRASRWPRSARDITSREAEQALVGQPPSDELFAQAAALARRRVLPGHRSARLAGIQAARRRRADGARRSAAPWPARSRSQG